jgi:hypothetical protein
MSKRITDITELCIGSLYEMAVNDYRGRVAWFEYSDDLRSADRPEDGSYVVYLGESPWETPYRAIRCYSFLSSEGKMYRVYNTDFIYGLKETQHEML